METSLAQDLMPDEEWAFFERIILAARAPNGRPHQHNLVLDGVFWIARTGAPWRDLPDNLPEPSVLLDDRDYDADRIRTTWRRRTC
ncbi:transposase [Rhodovulum sulfidophilum]|uniref:transposase n=1 Tax=Rhodovulum sulfidophilum TaxID=35806 RepID=UPI0022793575|nr:transposase [Rhodovulum sulfidophilum]